MDGRADQGNRFVSFAGENHYIFISNQDELLDGIERFVAGVRNQVADLDRCSPR